MELYVDKNTDLMLSTFIAVGIAELLHAIPIEDSKRTVTIRDKGSCYTIEVDCTVEQLTTIIEHTTALPPILPAIVKPLTNLDKKRIEAGVPEDETRIKYVPRDFTGEIIDYEIEKAHFFQWNRELNDNEAKEPRPEFSTLAHLCSYFGRGSAMRGGYQLPLHAWHAHQGEAAFDLWRLIHKCYGSFPNTVDSSCRTWKKHILPKIGYHDYEIKAEVSSLAVISPSTTKGISMGVSTQAFYEDTPNTFWLQMYFAFAGFLTVGMPFNINEDIVIYYPLPQEVTLDRLRIIINDYRRSREGHHLYRFSNFMNRAKVDALQYIRFYKIFAEKLLEATTNHNASSELCITGIVGYFYKNIVNHIPFGETNIFTPSWFSYLDKDTVVKAKRLLTEHEKIVNNIEGLPPKNQLKQEENKILETYRRYITAGDAKDWILFMIHYGGYLFRYLPSLYSKYPIPYQLFVESLNVMSKYINDKVDYRAILNNQGFQNVARAINYCTLYARYKKDVQGDGEFVFKVRHGLGGDLLRHAHDTSRFIEELSKFVQDYRDETITVTVNTGKSRTEIHFEDLQDIISLIAEYGSTVVAHLLVASGYAAHFPRGEDSLYSKGTTE